MREWDDNVLVDEDEQSQEKTQTNRTEGIHSWKLIKLWVVEDGTIVDTKDWNWMEKQKPKKKRKLQTMVKLKLEFYHQVYEHITTRFLHSTLC